MTYEVTSLQVCRNPLCGISLDGTPGISMQLGFCGDRFRRQYLILRTASDLLVPIGKRKGWKLLEEPEHGREDRPK